MLIWKEENKGSYISTDIICSALIGKYLSEKLSLSASRYISAHISLFHLSIISLSCIAILLSISLSTFLYLHRRSEGGRRSLAPPLFTKIGLKRQPRGSIFQNFLEHNNIWNLAPPFWNPLTAPGPSPPVRKKLIHS